MCCLPVLPLLGKCGGNPTKHRAALVTRSLSRKLLGTRGALFTPGLTCRWDGFVLGEEIMQVNNLKYLSSALN